MRRKLQQQGWLCGYSEASPDASTAIDDFFTDARQALPSGGVGAKLRARLQEFSISAGPIGVGFKLQESDNVTSYSRLLQFLTALGDLAKRNKVGVALLIDEAQALPPTELAILLRVVNGLDFPVMVVTAGLPGIPALLHLIPATVPPNYYLSLEPLNLDDTLLAIKTPIIDSGGSIDKEAADLLARFTSGHPLSIQMAASAAWFEADERTANDDALIVSVSDANAAIESTLTQLNISVYTPIWDGCTEPERAALRAVAKAETELDVLLSFEANSESALRSLIAKGILYNNPVEFVVPGFSYFASKRPDVNR